MKLIWEDPAPRKTGRKSKNEKIVTALKANPGKWARVAEGRGSAVSWFKANGCEAVGRTQSEGLIYTYARWPLAGEGKDLQPAPVKKPARKKKTAPAKAPAPRKANLLPAKKATVAEKATITPIRTTTLNVSAQDANATRAAQNGETTGNCPCGRRHVSIKDGRCRTCRTNARLRQVTA